ncbi:hypothetical protein Nepgr_000382 [Nepenthes gracilis]|uniref:Transcription factor GTE4 n=1 Tax=Nepenthes gracilis TaxID=150966 RepID=A0AAD3P3F5_NEPGR|nr:hypothetical protein Nepgr_000382 [Nepenthes gracilis]
MVGCRRKGPGRIGLHREAPTRNTTPNHHRFNGLHEDGQEPFHFNHLDLFLRSDSSFRCPIQISSLYSVLVFTRMATGGGSGGGGGGGAMERQKWAESKVYTRKSFKGPKIHGPPENSQTLASQDLISSKENLFSGFDVASDDSSSLNRFQSTNPSYGDMQSGNGRVGLRVENRILINLLMKSKKEKRDLRRKLQDELNLVRNLMKKIEKNNNLKLSVDEGVNGGKLKRVHSEVGSVGGHQIRPLASLIVPGIDNSQSASDNVEKEKRTPKANPFYQSSDFILGKDKSIVQEQNNKKTKTNGRKNGELGVGMANASSKVFKSCSALLDRLMKHKHAWVFDKPVDVMGLGLHDYHAIIKHPMDLGTVKSRLNTNWYKSPKDFAEDVRLTFHNAMTYNPKGHDVHIMAEQLLKIFEDKWVDIEADYLQELRVAADYEAGLPTPTSRKAPPPPPPLLPPTDMMGMLDRSKSVTNPVGPKPKSTNSVPSGRSLALKKPKAKDLNKRDMTYEEKQKLGTSLQNLPSEKLGSVVQIIKKKNPSLCQNDDEIEVDIDSVDTETLWELDRFVMNYRKNLSKIKRRAELAQGRTEAEPNGPEKNKAISAVEEPKESQTEDKNATSSSPVQMEKQEGNARRSNSSSSSSSDSGSSSTESDSNSSSA